MQHTTIRTRRNQGGFIQGAILLGLAILALVVGAFALANKGSATKSDLETAKVMASSVIKRGNDLRDAAFRLSQDRDLSKMELITGVAGGPTLTAGNFDLFSPTYGVASEALLPGKALTTGTDTAMVYDQAFKIGSAAADKKVFKLVGLTDATCRQVNKTIYNDSIDDATLADTAIDATREEGCVDVSGTFVYFKRVG